MKNNFLSLLAIATLVITSCKKEKVDPAKPTPQANIKFGYFEGFSGMSVYKNQSEIPLDSVIAHDLFGVSISESNHQSFNGFTVDSGVIEFAVTTTNDAELYNNRTNVDVKTTFSYDFFGVEYGSEMFLPYKISSVAIKGNDTIEIKDDGDFVKVNYQSKYSSGLNAIKTVSIKP